jgi:hypothetical protein
MTSYPPPIDKLLTLGDARTMRKWPDYRMYGLGPEHIPDLIRMVTDEDLNTAQSDSLQVWAPLHAWRALGQLRAESAVEPLTSLFHFVDDRHDDWVREEVPEVLGMIGPAAVSVVAAYLSDATHGMWARVAAATSLEEIAKRHPESRDECVAILTGQLSQFEKNTKTLNTFLIGPLIHLHAVECAPLIERVFAARHVDIAVYGDWEDVQIKLGLRQERATPKPDYLADSLGPELSAKLADLSRRIQIVEPQFQSKRTKAQKRDKRKQQEPRSKKRK